MASFRRRAALACLLAAAVPARLLATPEAGAPGAAPSPGESPAADPSAGQLLVAAPSMSDPRFARTVILMVQHDSGGAFGLAVNRPLGDRPIAALLLAMGEDAGDIQGSIPVLAGGPVRPAVGFVVHSGEYRLPDSLALDAQVSVSAPLRVLRDIAAGRGPRERILILGSAGWGPGQLEGELSLRAWATAQETPELVFDMDRTAVWKAAYARRMLSL